MPGQKKRVFFVVASFVFVGGSLFCYDYCNHSAFLYIAFYGSSRLCSVLPFVAVVSLLWLVLQDSGSRFSMRRGRRRSCQDPCGAKRRGTFVWSLEGLGFSLLSRFRYKCTCAVALLA